MKNIALILILALTILTARAQTSLVFLPTPSPTNSPALLDTNYTTINNDLIFLANMNYSNNAYLATVNLQANTNAGNWAIAEAQIASNAPAIYHSNSWSLYAVTNGMGNGDFWTGSSNGQALISLYLSNGIPIIKQLAP